MVDGEHIDDGGGAVELQRGHNGEPEHLRRWGFLLRLCYDDASPLEPSNEQDDDGSYHDVDYGGRRSSSELETHHWSIPVDGKRVSSCASL